MGPERALELGILDELAASGDVLVRALEVAGSLAALPGDAYSTVKRQLRGTTIAAVHDIVDRRSDPMLSSWLSQETAQAASRTLDGA